MRSLVAGVLAGLLLTGCADGEATSATPIAAFHGIEPRETTFRPSFVLQDTEGERYDFGERTSGRPTLLYFGYTNCPDECPTAMADIAGALRQTPAALREQTVVVFVTTDPDRDDAALVRRWLDMFSSEYVGLVGSQAEVGAAQAAVGVRTAEKGGPVETLPGRPDEHEHEEGTAPHTHLGPLGYGVAHANVIFAYDVADELQVLYPEGVRPSDIAADLPLLAQGDAS